ncbi:phospholipase D family protein [Pseudomonas sp. B21-017]|uniref:phospholipase D family protein n=1 Tax=Pseudomonas sp. B21-017 TaxID=2895474 RepID=UPI0021601E13|nr:phospholipase D family protein [Pseudomonas sp. B21-017]UVM36038.1 phospholipase D family protein [Pseudomonas sp. B21-017]
MFLGSREQILSAIKDLIQAPDADYGVAVAFWGNGSEALIPRQGAGRLICNLSHPGTNPYAVERIMAQPGIRMRQSSRLHAKVVVSNAGAIVGSANFSDAALGFEGQALGWNEAGVLLDPERDEFKQALDWFESTWDKAAEIEATDLVAAKEIWSARGFPDKPVKEDEPKTEEAEVQTVRAPMPNEDTPELYESDLFDDKPLKPVKLKKEFSSSSKESLPKYENKLRMANADIQWLFDNLISNRSEEEQLNGLPKDWRRYSTSHAANIIWIATGHKAQTNIDGFPVVGEPEFIVDRAKQLKTYDHVYNFLERLADEKVSGVKASVRYGAKEALRQITAPCLTSRTRSEPSK